MKSGSEGVVDEKIPNRHQAIWEVQIQQAGWIAEKKEGPGVIWRKKRTCEEIGVRNEWQNHRRKKSPQTSKGWSGSRERERLEWRKQEGDSRETRCRTEGRRG